MTQYWEKRLKMLILIVIMKVIREMHGLYII